MSEETCIFCKIVRGEIPSSVIFENEHCIAFMDVFPVTEGHCLLIPKKHYVNMYDVDPEVVGYLAKKLSDLSRRVQKATGAEGVLNIVANGEGAGQETQHDLRFRCEPDAGTGPLVFQHSGSHPRSNCIYPLSEDVEDAFITLPILWPAIILLGQQISHDHPGV